MTSISIKPIARHHGRFLCVISCVLFLCVLLASNFFWQQARLPLMSLVLIAIVIFFIGSLKYSEPEHSFVLTPESLLYAHRYGQWKLAWQQIANFNQVSETWGIERHSLPYIGVRLNKLTDIAPSISPRLASRLIHEQKTILAFCIRLQLLTLEQATINFDAYIEKKPLGENDSIITGPIAAFLHQSELLYQALGYHLFIPETSLDREINEFVALLKNCQRHSQKTY